MKKLNYSAPQIEIVRFSMEDVLADTLISGTGSDVGSAGENIFGGNSEGFNPFGGNN